MINAVGPLAGSRQLASPAATPAARSAAQTEFLTIFYKEILKQVFKTPSFNLDGEEEDQENSLLQTYGSDLMVNKLAEQMAQNSIAAQQWALIPNSSGEAVNEQAN